MRNLPVVSLGLLWMSWFASSPSSFAGVPFPAFLKKEWRSVERQFQWSCFRAEDVSYDCKIYDEYPDDPNSPYAYLYFKAKDAGKVHDYGAHSTAPLADCLVRLSDVHRFVKNQKTICMLGTPIDIGDGRLPFQYRYWFWEQLLTAKGCTSWFGRFCEDNGYFPKSVTSR